MNGADKLRLLSVCDKETGVCLFQRAWQWRGDQERSSIGKLVQSFYQFAREVDQGEISCVNFLVQSRTHRRVSSSQAARRTRGPTRSLPDSMQMLCTRNEDIIVAVFFDVKTCVTTSTENQGGFREFLHQVKNSFCETFAGRVVSLRPTLKECADGHANTNASWRLSSQCLESVRSAHFTMIQPDGRNILSHLQRLTINIYDTEDGVLRSVQAEFVPFKESVDQIRNRWTMDP